MPKNVTLRDIDELLRETWLECCWHLSSFDSGGTRFVSDGFDTSLFDYDHASFDHRAAWAIPQGREAEYQYDMGDTTYLTIRVEPAPEQAQAWLARHDIDAGDPSLRNLMPELCDNCGQEASHFRPAEVLCTGCLPENPRPYVELLARTPPHCRECGEEATSYRRPHTSCQDCRQEDHDNYRPLVNSPRDGIDCYDQSTPAEQREFEENYTEIGPRPPHRDDCLRAQGSGGNATGQPVSWPNWNDRPRTGGLQYGLGSESDDRTLHPIECVKLPDGSWGQTASTIRRHPQQGPQQC